MAKTKAAPAKKPGKAMMNWTEELARQAKIAAGIEASVSTGGDYIATRGGKLSFQGADIPGNSMNVIILDHVLENALYEGKFDPDSPSSPTCFALGTGDKPMAPHADSPEPQSEACEGCPHNEFGSADTGRGKACKNIRRLALLPEDALEDLDAATPAYIKVPVTSVRAWAGYVKKLASAMNVPPLAVITQISLVPHQKHQFEMLFKHAGNVAPEHIEGLLAKQKEVKDPLLAPYTPREEEAPKKGKKVKGRTVVAAKKSKFR